MDSKRLRSDLAILVLLPAPLFFVGLVLIGILVVADDGFLGLNLNSKEEIAPAETQSATISAEAYVLATIAAAPERPFTTRVSFKRDVLPILTTRCTYCHGPESILGIPPNGLLLDNYQDVIAGSNNLPVVMAGYPDISTMVVLLQRGAMPQNAERLPDDQIELISRWIAEGAPDN